MSSFFHDHLIDEQTNEQVVTLCMPAVCMAERFTYDWQSGVCGDAYRWHSLVQHEHGVQACRCYKARKMHFFPYHYDETRGSYTAVPVQLMTMSGSDTIGYTDWPATGARSTQLSAASCPLHVRCSTRYSGVPWAKLSHCRELASETYARRLLSLVAAMNGHGVFPVVERCGNERE